MKLFNYVCNTNKCWTNIILHYFNLVCTLSWVMLSVYGYCGSHILGCSYIRLTRTLCNLLLWLIFQRGLYNEINIKHAKHTQICMHTQHTVSVLTSLTWHHSLFIIKVKCSQSKNVFPLNYTSFQNSIMSEFWAILYLAYCTSPIRCEFGLLYITVLVH